MNAKKIDKTSGVKKRRKYTDEFKRDAVNRVLRTAKSCTKVGEELGINPNMLARWRREQIGDMDKASAPEEQLKPSEMAEMLAEARREVEDLREQRDILKKTLSIFTHPSQRGGKS